MRTFAAAVALTLSAIGAPLHAHAQAAIDPEVVRECVRVHGNARLLWNDGHWLEARDEMNGCGDSRCPAAIGSECRAWQDELTRVLPTVSIIVQHSDRDDESERATGEVDGQELATIEPFGRIEVNPGLHVVRVRLAGYEPVERSIVATPKRKNIVVVVRFKREPLPKLRSTRPIPPATYWLAGGAVTAFVASGALLWAAVAKRAEDERTCAPVCDDSDVAPIKRMTFGADMLGAVGIALGGLAIATFVVRPTVNEPAPTARVELHGMRGGGALQLMGSF